jgi:hypothetical protein
MVNPEDTEITLNFIVKRQLWCDAPYWRYLESNKKAR